MLKGFLDESQKGKEARLRRDCLQRHTGCRDGTGIDFANYRTGTLRRRIARRMLLEKTDLRRYVELLSTSPSKVEALRDDILINVTRFFRDPAMFVSLREKVLPGLVEGRSSHDPLRVWVLGCSTG